MINQRRIERTEWIRYTGDNQRGHKSLWHATLDGQTVACQWTLDMIEWSKVTNLTHAEVPDGGSANVCGLCVRFLRRAYGIKMANKSVATTLPDVVVSKSSRDTLRVRETSQEVEIGE